MLLLNRVSDLERRIGIDKARCKQCLKVEWIPILDNEPFIYCLECARLLVGSPDAKSSLEGIKHLEKIYEIARLKVN